MITDDWIGSVNNASWIEKDVDGKMTTVPLFGGKGPTGEPRRVSHDPKLRMYSGLEQATDRYLNEPENALIESFFPGMSAIDRYGENKPGGGQGLEGRLEALRHEHFGGDYKDTREEETVPITETTYSDYLNALQDLLLQIRDGDNFSGEIFTVPESVTTEDPTITERYEEEEHREGETRKGRGVGGAPRSKVAGEEVDQEEDIEDAEEAGFGLGEQQIDEERLPIKSNADYEMVQGKLWLLPSNKKDRDNWKRFRVTPTGEEEDITDERLHPQYRLSDAAKAKRAKAQRIHPTPNDRRFYTGDAPSITETFDPNASIPTKKHNTVTKRIMASDSKPKRVQHTAASLERTLKPLPSMSDTPDNREKIAADRAAGAAKAAKQQGTENVT